MPTVLVKNVRNQDHSFEVTEGATIFDQLDQQNFPLPHGCLAGSCGSCRIHVAEGRENLLPMGAVENDTVEHLKANNPHYADKNVRLSCRAKINGSITIELLK